MEQHIQAITRYHLEADGPRMHDFIEWQ
jgi:hypothetical protein